MLRQTKRLVNFICSDKTSAEENFQMQADDYQTPPPDLNIRE